VVRGHASKAGLSQAIYNIRVRVVSDIQTPVARQKDAKFEDIHQRRHFIILDQDPAN
jgi:hypothetical protein